MRDILRSCLKIMVATLASLMAWVVAVKIMAVTLGAAGVGLFGLLRQLLQHLALIASVNGQSAVVQGIASRQSETDKIEFMGNAMRIQLYLVVVTGAGLWCSAPWLAHFFIPHPKATALLRYLVFAMIATVAQTLFIGILNGYRMVNDLVRSQVVGPIVTLILAYPMVLLIRGNYSFGYVLMLAMPAFAIAMAAAYAVSREGHMPSLVRFRIDWSYGRVFLRMSSVLLIVGVFTTGTQFYMSWYVAKKLGLVSAGCYWTSWTMSMAYVTIFLGSFGSYYMPSLSGLVDEGDRKKLIRSYLRLALVVMPMLVSTVILIKPLVIRILFSKELLPALLVMRWMLIGDLLKGVAWVLSLPMFAVGHIRWYLWSEVFINTAIALSSGLWLYFGGGVQGLGVLFLMTYVVYLFLMTYYAHSKLRFSWENIERVTFLAGCALVVCLSLLMWNDLTFRPKMIFPFLIGNLTFLVFAFRDRISNLCQNFR